MRHMIIIVLVLVMSGCSTELYKNTGDGKFSGALDVRWVNNDYFLFLPNKDNPFTFTRPNGQSIRPGKMYTDGGSIPRFFWGVKGFSPWGYAPAYIVHDWMFEAQHCGYVPDNKYKFKDSVDVMAESLKAVMEQDTKVRDYFVFDSVVTAINSPIANRLWDKGSCKVPPVGMESLIEGAEPGELLMTIKFE